MNSRWELRYPLFIMYCMDNSLTIEVVHDLTINHQELYHDGYRDFEDVYKEIMTVYE